MGWLKVSAGLLSTQASTMSSSLSQMRMPSSDRPMNVYVSATAISRSAVQRAENWSTGMEASGLPGSPQLKSTEGSMRVRAGTPPGVMPLKYSPLTPPPPPPPVVKRHTSPGYVAPPRACSSTAQK